MPNFDGTGRNGQGAGTGRGLGNCSSAKKAQTSKPKPIKKNTTKKK